LIFILVPIFHKIVSFAGRALAEYLIQHCMMRRRADRTSRMS
jgi:hypothetical protein